MKTIDIIKKILELLGGCDADMEAKLAALEAASTILRADGEAI